MKKTQKIIFTLLLTVAIILPATVGAFATSPERVQPRWASIATIELDMTFDGDDGNASGAARKQSTATNIEGELMVHERVGERWVYVSDGYAEKPVGTLAVSVDFPAEEGSTYKAVFTVTAYTGDDAETEVVEYTETY